MQDRQHQSQVNSGYENFALTQVNSILGEWRDWIPFSQQVTFTNVDNLEATTFASVVNVNYVLNRVSAPLREKNLTQFLELKNVLELLGVPQIYYFDQLTQSIDVYPHPSNPTYSFLVNGRILHPDLSLIDEIPANMPGFMTQAVTYETGFRLIAQYGGYWSDEKEKLRLYLIELLQRKNSRDITPPRNIVFGRPSGLDVPPYPWLWAISGGQQ